jgi:FtsP/CotA-like multicopper oxidase with cupredoxin domain
MTSSSGGKYAVTTLTPGKAHMLRLLNVGINNWAHVALDGHKFTVVSADFVPIVPYETDSLSIAVGKLFHISVIMCPTVIMHAIYSRICTDLLVKPFTDPLARLQVSATM